MSVLYTMDHPKKPIPSILLPRSPFDKVWRSRGGFPNWPGKRADMERVGNEVFLS